MTSAKACAGPPSAATHPAQSNPGAVSDRSANEVVDAGYLLYVVEHGIALQAHPEEHDIGLIRPGQSPEGSFEAAGGGRELMVSEQFGRARADGGQAMCRVQAAAGFRAGASHLCDAAGPAGRAADVEIGRVIRTQFGRAGESGEEGGAAGPQGVEHAVDNGIGPALHMTEALKR